MPPTRYWPLGAGRVLTSPFGPRAGGFHYGVDLGFPGGSGGRPVYAVQSGRVIHAGKADGYGGDASGLAGWLVVDSDDAQGAGCLEYGHIVRLPGITPGSQVTAGQQIAVINPNAATNGGTAPHLHLSDMPRGYDPAAKQDPLPRLRGAMEPSAAPVVLVNKKEPAVAAVAIPRPDFNEYAMWSGNHESRAGTPVDMILLHTQQGGGNADSLARWLQNPANQVSYHYTVSEDPVDHGVTVCDVVDTDLASWSCLSGNGRSINICLAGSYAEWTREQWLSKAPRAIDVAAYLAALDAAKYNVPRRVIKPPYGPPGGVSDHRWVTRWLKDGTHTDVGGPMSGPWTGFPWDVFEAAFARYSGTPAPAPAKPAPPPPAPPAPAKPAPQYPRDYTDRQLLEDVWRQLMAIRGAK